MNSRLTLGSLSLLAKGRVRLNSLSLPGVPLGAPLFALVLAMAVRAADVGTPLVIWHSQPVKPGQTVLLYGDELDSAKVTASRLPDETPGDPGKTRPANEVVANTGEELAPIQPRERALKVLLPDGKPSGVFALQVEARGRRQTVLVNAPQPWWARGAQRLAATPGEDLRVFGLGLGWAGVNEALAGIPPGSPRTRIALRGAREVELTVRDADLYSARAPLPGDLPAGEYEVWVHNGCGGPQAWARCPEPLRVQRAEHWPEREFNVLHHGARAMARLTTPGRFNGHLLKPDARAAAWCGFRPDNTDSTGRCGSPAASFCAA